MEIEFFVKEAIEEFCTEFIRHPYLCYTEHGQHARFYSMLYNKLPRSKRYINFENEDVCVIQKEYPTADSLGKPRRQNWDIAVIDNPPNALNKFPAYDYFMLNSVIEFGLNEPTEHLVDDIKRVCHKDANIKNKFIVHLYRISPSGNPFSGRDWSDKSKRIVSLDEIKNKVQTSNFDTLSIYLGVYDKTNSTNNGVWCVSKSDIQQLV